MGSDFEDLSDSLSTFADNPFDYIKDRTNQVLAANAETVSLGLLEFEGGKLRPRGTREAEAEAKAGVQAELRNQAAIRKREADQLKRQDLQASRAGAAARRSANRDNSPPTGSDLGSSNRDFLGL